MGMLLIAATTLLVISNTNGTVFAQSGNNVPDCVHTLKVIISKLPKQTADATTQVTLSNIGPNVDRGSANINIPGIGSGNILVNFQLTSSYAAISASVNKLHGQTGNSELNPGLSLDFCGGINNNALTDINIPGIGTGRLDMSMGN